MDTQTSAGMRTDDVRGTVVVYSGDAFPSNHERSTRHELARRLAALRGYAFGGEFDRFENYEGHVYFLPGDTLPTLDEAGALRIRDAEDLFGGVVPYPFVATKTITHPLPAGATAAPPGWSTEFGQRVQEVVLPGFTAFSPADVRRAAAMLFAQGDIRLKKPSGIGGSGQYLLHDMDELEALLQDIDPQEVMREGLVLERNLADITTHSVGQVRIGGLLASYYGVQRLTINNAGEEVYGGSELLVRRGDFDVLLQAGLPPDVHTAVAQACTYHAAALASFPGMFASRCNYDIAQGVDTNGNWHSGVLEQSWRAGGASGAEVAALEAFMQDHSLNEVRASTVELYGETPRLPEDAVVYFCGIDECVGPMMKYARIEKDAYP